MSTQSLFSYQSSSEKEAAPKFVLKASELESRLLQICNEEVHFFDSADAFLLKCTQMKSILTALKSDPTISQEEEEQHEFPNTIFGRTSLQRACSCTDDNHQEELVHVTFPSLQLQQEIEYCDLHVQFSIESCLPKTNQEIYSTLERILCCTSRSPFVSPWFVSSSSPNEPKKGETIFCILFPKNDDDLLFQQLCNFRVGDVSPSFYLHCCITPTALPNHPLEEEDMAVLLKNYILKNQAWENTYYNNSFEPKTTYTMLIYRQIPPRLHLQKHPTLFSQYFLNPENKQDTHGNLSENDNCNLFTMNIDNTNSLLLRETPLWELYLAASTPNSNSNNQRIDEEDEISNCKSNTFKNCKEEQLVLLRSVSPPYITNWKVYYGDILEHFLEPNNFQMLQHEARSIPQWTPWPEQQHYSTATSTSSWTVFPLVHTFPAQSASNRKWIQTTSTFCPHTCRLLRKTNFLNNKLRTALFSRLGPDTTLSPHTGWEDLANFVLRVHIPLLVPSNCGTWVDGCIQMHKEGVVQVFDDSKVHRAFNYHPTKERVVLIIDLVRPESLPIGTAVGGHTEELDEIIKDMV